jgi:3-hydroxymyristoyl/3-hydroxydecanoyl-(acyl carrier protein) dehydratase
VTSLPRVAQRSRDGDSLRLTLHVTADLAAFEGHFPGTPILAAVVQVDWAVRFARDAFDLPAHFRALRALKFLAVVQPPVDLTLELARDASGLSVAFTYLRAGTACSSGRIEFADDAPGPDRSVL